MLLEILITAFNAVLPILLLILLGYLLKQKGFFTDEFVKLGNKLVFKVCLPVMLFMNIYKIDSFANIPWDLVLFGLATSLVLFAIGVVVALVTTKEPSRRGVVLQCVFRSNFAIIGLPLAQILGGEEAVVAASVLLTFTIPLYNMLAVISLCVFVNNGQSKGETVKTVLRNILHNPLIIASALALMCLLLRLLQTEVLGQCVFTLSGNLEFLYIALGYLSNATTPLSLIVLGGQFVFSAVKGLRKEIIVSTLFRVVVCPVIGIGAAWLFSSLGVVRCGPAEYPALLSLFGTPVAVSSAIMATQMKNDGQLAAQLVVWTSVCSMFTLFAMICAMMSIGLLPI